ncbi:GDSL esterase/lipase [Acorus calamus]|uniref:GDSL esterase/lipase n=1 Tax=Acorus calamus TaxID=4465 RepID=A0AAV9FC96_ACOCL|nr:GDSL esterase/lipase [Acorus calamus]
MAGSKVVYVDIYTPLLDMVTNPNKYGFEETGRGCCGTGLIEMGPTCDSFTPTCADASKYLFGTQSILRRRRTAPLPQGSPRLCFLVLIN